MKFLCLAFLALTCIELTTAQFFGFGCGEQVPTRGRQCHMAAEKNTVFCEATGSSTYHDLPGYYGVYGYYSGYSAYLAVDGHLSPGNTGFYHSSLEQYPWLKIELFDLTQNATQMDVSRVEVYLRCDVNNMYHDKSYEIRGTSDPSNPETYITATPRLIGGKVCGTQDQVVFTGGNKFYVQCITTITAAKEIWIQRLPNFKQHSNYNGNRWNIWTGNARAQNSNSFLVINEVVLY